MNSIVRLVQCPARVLAGGLITKETRHTLFGNVAGGAGSRGPEDFQRQAIIDGTGVPCAKTDVRINLRTNTLREIAHPNKHDDGFDYSEDFDGVQLTPTGNIYVNLKCIVGKGGAQTRSLREVYWFVQGQLNVLKSGAGAPAYFANVLDGDEAAAVLPKFTYLLSRPEFADVSKKVYVGDLKGYFDWFASLQPSTAHA